MVQALDDFWNYSLLIEGMVLYALKVAYKILFRFCSAWPGAKEPLVKLKEDIQSTEWHPG